MKTCGKKYGKIRTLKFSSNKLGISENYIYTQAIHDLLNQVFFGSGFEFSTIINDLTTYSANRPLKQN